MARLARFKRATIAVKNGKTILQVPARSEDEIQIAIINWATLQKYKGRPLAYYLVHPANGGYRKDKEAAKLKRMGVQAGYPDLMLDIPKGGYHGLRIELKKLKGGRTQDNQKERIDMLNEEGYYAVVCKGFADATNTIKKYMAKSEQGEHKDDNYLDGAAYMALAGEAASVEVGE